MYNYNNPDTDPTKKVYTNDPLKIKQGEDYRHDMNTLSGFEVYKGANVGSGYSKSYMVPLKSDVNLRSDDTVSSAIEGNANYTNMAVKTQPNYFGIKKEFVPRARPMHDSLTEDAYYVDHKDYAGDGKNRSGFLYRKGTNGYYVDNNFGTTQPWKKYTNLGYDKYSNINKETEGFNAWTKNPNVAPAYNKWLADKQKDKLNSLSAQEDGGLLLFTKGKIVCKKR